MITPINIVAANNIGTGSFVTSANEVKVTLIDFNVSRKFREKKSIQSTADLSNPDSPVTRRLMMLT